MRSLKCYISKKKYSESNIILKVLDQTKLNKFFTAGLLRAFMCCKSPRDGCSVQHFLNTFLTLELSLARPS